mmetsp:Transcript_22909/g.22093  ORF Transcript_22909/g.22093 Transcript_22909/m.22093 type:complete len:98 (-) Transcript_22909:5-298(-)
MGIFHSAVELDSNILVLGIDFSGKTTIVKRMMTMQFNPVDDKDTTKNMNVYMDEVTLNIPTQVQLVDRLLKIFLSFYWPQLRDFSQLYMIIDSDIFE